MLPSALRHRGSNTRIIYCDDDRICPPDWTKLLVKKSLERPQDCIVNAGVDLELLGMPTHTPKNPKPQPRAKRRRGLNHALYWVDRLIHQLKTRTLSKPPRKQFLTDGYLDIGQGCGGVSVSPEFFDDYAFDIPDVLWAVDDVWLSGCLTRNGTRIWVDAAGKMPRRAFGHKRRLVQGCSGRIRPARRRQGLHRAFQDEIWDLVVDTPRGVCGPNDNESGKEDDSFG